MPHKTKRNHPLIHKTPNPAAGVQEEDRGREEGVLEGPGGLPGLPRPEGRRGAPAAAGRSRRSGSRPAGRSGPATGPAAASSGAAASPGATATAAAAASPRAATSPGAAAARAVRELRHAVRGERGRWQRGLPGIRDQPPAALTPATAAAAADGHGHQEVTPSPVA